MNVLLLLLLASPAQPQWTMKVVGASPDFLLLHMEQPLERTRPARLYLLELWLERHQVSRATDMYAGLAEWSAAHPEATDAEWKAEAARVRAENWKKIESDFVKAYGIKPGGGVKSTPVPAGWKRLALPQTKITLERECEGCEVFAVEGARRTSLGTGLDPAQLYTVPKHDAVFFVLQEPTLVLADGKKPQVTGLWALRKAELAAANDVAAPPPGTAFVADAKGAYTHQQPSLASPRVAPVAGSLLVVLGEPQNGFVKVLQREQVGADREGWLRLRDTKPDRPGLAAATKLKLEGGFQKVNDVWRYRVVAKNPEKVPVALADLELATSCFTPRTSGGGQVRTLEGSVPAGGELVLVDEPVQLSADPKSQTRVELFVAGGNTWFDGTLATGFSNEVGTLEHTPSILTREHVPVSKGPTQKLPWPLSPEPPAGKRKR